MQCDGEPVATHQCPWPGCCREVKPHLWGCQKHWYKLPERIRKGIWMKDAWALREVTSWVESYVVNHPEEGNSENPALP